MERAEVLEEVQRRLGVRFRDPDLLAQALRHRSMALESPLESNERMEFLGDSILGLVVCEHLVEAFPEAPEGELAKAKAFLVSEPTLAEAGRLLGLDQAVELSASEEASGGRQRRSILSDVFEAVVAAVYLDRGIRTARRVVLGALGQAMERVARQEHDRDFKSRLQELLQASERKTPRYRIVAETGADHDKTFVARVHIGRRIIGEGSGKSKKEAEQRAAEAALGILAPREGKERQGRDG